MLIGTLCALDMSARFQYGFYFVGVSALFGGFVAYCAVDFEHFCAGVRRAYKEVVNWHLDRVYWKTYLVVWVGISTLFSTALFAVIVSALVLGTHSGSESLIDEMVVYVLVGTSIGLIFCSTVISFAMLAKGKSEREDRTLYLERLKMDYHFGKLMLKTNLISVMYWACLGVGWVVIRVPYAIGTICHTVVRVVQIAGLLVARAFVHVHSERRVLCLVDVTLFTFVAYFYGYAFVGAIIGGVVGVIHHELVSVRWLKLAKPVRSVG